TAGGAWWPAFDSEVFGGNYTGHHNAGPPTFIRAAPDAQDHPILSGVDLQRLVGHGSLYTVSPLKNNTQLLLIGSVPDQPAEPVAWTHWFGDKKGRVFYTSL